MDIELSRTHVVLREDHVAHTADTNFPHTYSTGALDWDFEEFKKNFQVVVGEKKDRFMEFDLIGLDAPIANALRRILISEVPSMAIETVYMDANTSILFDEFLSHRFGLIPILADPREFDFSETDVGITDLTTIVFRIDITCTKKAGALGDELEPSERYNNSSVYSSDLIWTPAGNQKDRYIDNPPKVAYDDILIAKLRPGQRIAATLHCSKGIGKEHAKWSPVGTATYRLLPDIRILKPITGADAIKFQKCFLEGTIEVVDIKGVKTARVLNPRKDTASREALRHPEFKDKVLLTRIRDHFIFNIESTGCLPPDILFGEAASILAQKCINLKNALNEIGLIE